jgi:hypothetical protein
MRIRSWDDTVGIDLTLFISGIGIQSKEPDYVAEVAAAHLAGQGYGGQAVEQLHSKSRRYSPVKQEKKRQLTIIATGFSPSGKPLPKTSSRFKKELAGSRRALLIPDGAFHWP